MFSGASNFVDSVDTAFLVVTVISVFFLVLITTLMIVFVLKYNKKKNPKAVNIHGNIPLEITWTVIPTILVLVMFWFGWVGYKEMSTIPEDSIEINVTAQMWKWTFTYKNGVKSDSLYVPLKKNVKLNLNSLDVNHAFFVPAFRVKKDVIPGRTNTIWFSAEELGKFDIACAEYCGLNHWNMYTKVIVIPANDFDNWLNAAKDTTSVNTSMPDTTGSDSSLDTNGTSQTQITDTTQN